MKCDNVCASKTGKEGENNKREIETATRERERMRMRGRMSMEKRQESLEAEDSQNKAKVSGSFCFYLGEHDILPLSFSNTFLPLPGLKTEIITMCACLRPTGTLVSSVPEIALSHLRRCISVQFSSCAHQDRQPLPGPPPPAQELLIATAIYDIV